jgi:hydrogenase expression/formation protein HypD
MQYVDEYRDPKIAKAIVERIAGKVSQPWVLMEVCGGQTPSCDMASTSCFPNR